MLNEHAWCWFKLRGHWLGHIWRAVNDIPIQHYVQVETIQFSLWSHSAKSSRRVSGYLTFSVTRRQLLDALEVHMHTNNSTFLSSQYARMVFKQQLILVGRVGIQDEAMDAARSAIQGAHYCARNLPVSLKGIMEESKALLVHRVKHTPKGFGQRFFMSRWT